MRSYLLISLVLVTCSCSAQQLENTPQCAVFSLAGISTDTIKGELYYVLPMLSPENYHVWCGSFLPTGNWVGYYDSLHSKIESLFSVIKGKGLHGKCMTWYLNGKKKRVALYDEGSVFGYDSNWYENGQLYYVKFFKTDGVTVCSWWYRNGKKKRQYQWKNEVPVGTWYEYDNKGILIRKENKE